MERSLILLTATIIIAASTLSDAQVPDEKAEALVNCGFIQAEPLTPYGFAKATLVSLWFAKNAFERGVEVNLAARESSNFFAFQTAMLRIAKASTNDFICAKRSVKPFLVQHPSDTDNMGIAAVALMIAYDEHIDINQRFLDLVKKMDNVNQMTTPAMADRISSLQVERDQRWADVVQPVFLAVASLINTKYADKNGEATRLTITNAQKHAMLNWATEHFPELKAKTSKDKLSEPAKDVQLYFTVLEGHKGSDE